MPRLTRSENIVTVLHPWPPQAAEAPVLSQPEGPSPPSPAAWLVSSLRLGPRPLLPTGSRLPPLSGQGSNLSLRLSPWPSHLAAQFRVCSRAGRCQPEQPQSRQGLPWACPARGAEAAQPPRPPSQDRRPQSESILPQAEPLRAQ